MDPLPSGLLRRGSAPFSSARQHLGLPGGSLAEDRTHHVRLDLVGLPEGYGPRLATSAFHYSVRIGQHRPLVED
jgi:hypothetical protein